MTKLIKNWDELSQVPANDKYKIIVDRKMGSGYIIPVYDERVGNGDEFKCHCNCKEMSVDEYFKHHVYLNTHTFYGSQYKYSTRVLQEHGFDVEIDNWDKESKSYTTENRINVIEFKNGIHNIKLVEFVPIVDESVYRIIFHGIDNDGVKIGFRITVSDELRMTQLLTAIKNAVPRDIVNNVEDAVYDYIRRCEPYAWLFVSDPYVEE